MEVVIIEEEKIVETGLHVASVIHTELGATKTTNKPRLTIQWLIEEGDQAGKSVYSNFVLNEPKPMEVYRKMVHFLGADPKMITPNNAAVLVHRKCRLHVVVKEYQGRQVNSVEHYYPLADNFGHDYSESETTDY